MLMPLDIVELARDPKVYAFVLTTGFALLIWIGLHGGNRNE